MSDMHTHSSLPDSDALEHPHAAAPPGSKPGRHVDIVAPPGEAGTPVLPPPDAIPGYQILRELNATDRAATYEALQMSSQRRVTIKVLNTDPLAAPQDQARFEAVCEALALIEHPRIVTILDTGVVAGARYFVSESVSGQSLRQYIAGGRRSISTSLRLLSRICDAVAVAHHESIVHGSLKPGNILVDTAGEATLLDFGFPVTLPAGRANADGTSQDFIPWMSPERLAGDAVDSRSDVYSLGVIMFQMLTGMLPYEPADEPAAMLERIHGENPLRPSTVRGEIDDRVEAIVLKCLHADPAQRYENAGDLSAAIQKCLRGESAKTNMEPFGRSMARPPRRGRVAGIVTAALVVTCAGGMAIAAFAWRQANSQTHQLVAQRHVVEQERDQALAAVANERTERLAAARRREEAEAARSAEAALRQKAEEATAKAREEVTKPTALARALTEILMDVVNAPTLEPVYRRTVEAQRKYLGDGHTDVAITLNVLARVLRDHGNLSEAESSLREALTIIKDSGASDLSVAQVVTNLATILRDRNELPAAEALQRESLAMTRRLSGDEGLVAINMSNLATILQKKGDLAGAENMAHQSLDILNDRLGDDHADVIFARNMLAELLVAQKKFPQAETILLSEYKRCSGHSHADPGAQRLAVRRLARLYAAWGRSHDAATWESRLAPAKPRSPS